MNSRLMRSQVLLFIAGVLASAPAPAATYIWTGGGANGNWTTTANWNPSSGYPGVFAADVAKITLDADAVLDGSAAFAQLYVGAPTTSPMNVVSIAGAAVDPPLLSVASLFNIGANDPHPDYQPRGELHLDDVALKIGSESSPATFFVGAEYSSRRHLPRGILKQTGGSFEAYLGNTRIGYCGSAISATSTNLVDLSAVTGGKLRITGNVNIGYGQTRTLVDVLLGEDWDVALGTDEAPITLSLAHSTLTQNDKFAHWHQASGLFRGRFSTVNLGYAAINSPSKVASGVMSFGPGTSVDISAGNLRVACGNDLIITGRLDAAATANGRLEVSSLFQIAQQSNGQYRRGEVLLGTNWCVRIGSPETPAAAFSMSAPEASKSPSLYESFFAMHGGSFSAWCTNMAVAGSSGNLQYSRSAEILLTGLTNVVIHAGSLVVGEVSRSTSSSCASSGVLDMGTSSGVSWDLGQFRVGCLTYPSSTGFSGRSRVAAGRGEGVAKDVMIGNGSRTDHPYGVLELNGMRLAVTNSLLVGANGTVSNNVCGASSGVSLAANVVPTLTGKMVVDFTQEPEGRAWTTPANADGVYWGLRWEGDHVAEVEALISTGKIAVLASGLDAGAATALDVFHDAADDATYIGLYTRVVHDATVILVR